MSLRRRWQVRGFLVQKMWWSSFLSSHARYLWSHDLPTKGRRVSIPCISFSVITQVFSIVFGTEPDTRYGNMFVKVDANIEVVDRQGVH